MVANLENPMSLENSLDAVREDPRNRKAYFIRMTFTRRWATPLVIGAFDLLGDVEVVGAQKMPARGPVILAPNHVTNFDVIPLQQAVMPRPIYYMGKEELFRNPIADGVLRHLGAFPVYRGAGDEWAMQHARKVLCAGQVLGIFPEGTRSKGKGLRTAKTGAARLALETGCPIVPVALQGTQAMFKRFPRRAPIHIELGGPIYPKPGEGPLALTDRMMFALAAMLPENQRGVYSVHPKGF